MMPTAPRAWAARVFCNWSAACAVTTPAQGLFSSRSDEISYVASEVHAGGWLAYHLLEAVRGRVESGADRALQLDELARYLQRGYRNMVRGRQHLVVAAGPRAANPTLWRTQRSTMVAIAGKVE